MWLKEKLKVKLVFMPQMTLSKNIMILKLNLIAHNERRYCFEMSGQCKNNIILSQILFLKKKNLLHTLVYMFNC